MFERVQHDHGDFRRQTSFHTGVYLQITTRRASTEKPSDTTLNKDFTGLLLNSEKTNFAQETFLMIQTWLQETAFKSKTKT